MSDLEQGDEESVEGIFERIARGLLDPTADHARLLGEAAAFCAMMAFEHSPNARSSLRLDAASDEDFTILIFNRGGCETVQRKNADEAITELHADDAARDESGAS